MESAARYDSAAPHVRAVAGEPDERLWRAVLVCAKLIHMKILLLRRAALPWLRKAVRETFGSPWLRYQGVTGIASGVTPLVGPVEDGSSTLPTSTIEEQEAWAAEWAPSLWYSDQLGQERPNEYDENRDLVRTAVDANLVGSYIDRDSELGRHHVVIDVDHPVLVIQSTQKDHNHLYIKLPRSIHWDAYEEWLEASAKIGLISRQYLRHSKIRKMTCLRLPWVKKQPKRDPRTGAATFGWIGMSSEGADDE